MGDILEIKIIEKKSISLTSVKKIISVTPHEASFVLSYATVTIKGETLEIEKITENQSEITLKGLIKEIIFDSNKLKNKDSFFKKLFQ